MATDDLHEENDSSVWGVHPVLTLLKHHPEKVGDIAIQQSRRGAKIQEIIDMAKEHGIRYRFVPTIRMPDQTENANHQGVLARTVAYGYTPFEDLLANLRETPSPIVLALDSIQDPHNLGAIIRSGTAAGVAGVIINKDRSAPLSGAAVKASAGTVIHTPVCRVTNLTTAIQQLKEAGVWIYGALKGAERSLYQTDLTGPVCIVIGGEEKGIRPLVRKQCDFLISIPMQRDTNSLNASVAAGVILFEMVRQRTLPSAR